MLLGRSAWSSVEGLGASVLTFCAVLFCAIVYAGFVGVIFAFTFLREIVLNSIKIPEPHQDKRGDL